MALQVREKERENVCIRPLPSLVTHAIGYRMAAVTGHTIYAAITQLFMLCCIWQAAQCSPGTANDGVHNIVYALTRLAGYTVFAWYGKRRHSQYCLCSNAFGRLYSVRLTWPDVTVL